MRREVERLKQNGDKVSHQTEKCDLISMIVLGERVISC